MAGFGVGKLAAGVGRPRVDPELAMPPRINVTFNLEQRDWIAAKAAERSCSVADVIRGAVNSEMIVDKDKW